MRRDDLHRPSAPLGVFLAMARRAALSLPEGRAAPFALLITATVLLFLGGLGHLPLFGRDEALYAEAGREMLASGDWVTPRVNGGPFLEKPPLLYWLAAASFRVLGAHPFAARLPAALLAILTVVLTVRIGARAWGRRAGLLAGIALATSLQMVLIGRMGIMDVPLTCLTVLALLAYERWRTRPGIMVTIGLGACFAFGVLLKGLAGLIGLSIVVLDVLIGIAGGRRTRPSAILLLYLALAIFIAIAAPWFLAMNARHGQAFTSTLFLQEHLRRMVQPMQGHGGPFWIYLPLIAVSFFPWVMFLPSAFITVRRAGSESAGFWRRLSIIWIAYVLVLFSLVATKLPGYVTPLFPAMALLVGAGLDRRLERPGRGPWLAVLIGSVVLAAAVALLPAAGARLGARVGAAQQARALVLPVAVWMIGYGVIAAGAAAALLGRARVGLGLLVAGQVVVVAAVLFGILPVLSPYLGGGSAQLAQRAQQELPGSRIVLYDTRPETVNFVLQRPVPTFGDTQRRELLEALRAGPTALIAPVTEEGFWRKLPVRRVWRAGDRVLLDLPRLNDAPAPVRGMRVVG